MFMTLGGQSRLALLCKTHKNAICSERSKGEESRRLDGQIIRCKERLKNLSRSHIMLPRALLFLFPLLVGTEFCIWPWFGWAERSVLCYQMTKGFGFHSAL
jgi:hypothetical protein